MKVATTIMDLYRRNRQIPWISLSAAFLCIIITAVVIIWPSMYPKLVWSNSPEYLWQYVSGAFVQGDNTTTAMAIMHLAANLLMFLPYGFMIEKLIGHKKFAIVFLGSWLGISFVFQVIVLVAVPAGELATGNGFSGSSYAVVSMGAYILFRLFVMGKKKFLSQPLAYLFLGGLLGELFVLLPAVAGVWSMIIHMSGIAIGIIMSIVFRKDINNHL